MKVLIVDDSRIDISIICNAISQIDGIDAFFATTADKAIDMAIEIQPDLIILDVVLPHMNGIEVKSRLSRHIHTSTIPVVFVTASGESTEKDCYRMGCIEFITKPINIIKLVDVIKRQSFITKLQELIESNNKVCKALHAY